MQSCKFYTSIEIDGQSFVHESKVELYITCVEELACFKKICSTTENNFFIKVKKP